MQTTRNFYRQDRQIGEYHKVKETKKKTGVLKIQYVEYRNADKVLFSVI